jgi:hypothetical protein
MGTRSKIKRAALAALAAVASVGATAGVAAAAVTVATDPNRVGAVSDDLQPQTVKVEETNANTTRVGPGIHRLFQRPLTGLEIRAVRIAKRNAGTNRTARSKYTPNGIPARVRKASTQLKAA